MDPMASTVAVSGNPTLVIDLFHFPESFYKLLVEFHSSLIAIILNLELIMLPVMWTGSVATVPVQATRMSYLDVDLLNSLLLSSNLQLE